MTVNSRTENNSLVVVLPVFGNVGLATECLRSILADVRGINARVIVINDRGPESDQVDAALRLELSASADAFRLLTNPTNLGLVESLNKVLQTEVADNDDVLLVNSDVRLVPGAISEMRRVLRADASTGIVCPRSDNATIATVPGLKGMPRTDLMRTVADWASTQPESSTVPVAVGFCMVVRGELFRKFGLFDQTFSPGYGEENDFSMRIRQGGWRVALANRAFAFHIGGASFGRGRAAVLQIRNEIVFRRRYPRYTFDRERYLAEENEQSTRVRRASTAVAFGVALIKQIVFTVLGLAPRTSARLVVAIRKYNQRFARVSKLN